MITNELSVQELEELLLPFLHIKIKEERDKVLKQVLQFDFVSYLELSAQKRIKFRHAGFDLKFYVSDNEMYLSLTKSCLFPRWFSSRGPIRELLDICKREISGLRFERLDVQASVPSEENPWSNQMKPFTLYIDPRNVDLNLVKKDPLLYSPSTVICFFERRGMAHVELCFRLSGYRRVNGVTLPVEEGQCW